MSRISQISKQYHDALSASLDQYDGMYHDRVEATRDFYDAFFHTQVIDYSQRLTGRRHRERLHERLRRVFKHESIQFVAIDGTCARDTYQDLAIFYGGAYGARGEISLDASEPRVHYKRWSLDHDVSLVAWVPVPFARLEEVGDNTREHFIVSDEERVNLASVHLQLMQLAELFLAFNFVRSSRLDAPDVVMMDLSPSSLMASVARSQDRVGLVGYPYDRRSLTRADMAIALAHPISDHFRLPSPRVADAYRVIVATLQTRPTVPVHLDELARTTGLRPEVLRGAADFLVEREVLLRPSIGNPGYRPAVRVDDSWAYVKDLFQSICRRLFVQKDPTALQYDAPDEGGVPRQRWMAPDDLGFLAAVGIRALIEACWERDVLLYGLVKDSASRYLTRNYLGVTLETGYHAALRDLEVKPLPWTDRIFCEMLPHVDPGLSAPWATVEFDSAFMTLHREQDPGGSTRVAGVMGRIVNQERLFARSLGQFFLSRAKATPLAGHVVFLERLLSPLLDPPVPAVADDQLLINEPALGRFPVVAWRDRDAPNPGQEVMMYLLSVLTRNHYAEAIGYPDPLHKADWGAKTVGRTVAEMVKSSGTLMATRPLARTFRQVRDRAGR